MLLKQRLEHHAPKENEVKRKLPYKLVKIVCYKVLKSLQRWWAGRVPDTNVALRWRRLLNGWDPPRESCPDGVLKSLGMQRKGQRPRIYVSRECWRSFISLAWRLRVLNNISSKPLSSICSPPATVDHPPLK